MGININITSKVPYALLLVLLILLTDMGAYVDSYKEPPPGGHDSNEIGVSVGGNVLKLQDFLDDIEDRMKEINSTKMEKGKIKIEQKTYSKDCPEDDTCDTAPCPSGWIRTGCSANCDEEECDVWPAISSSSGLNICKGGQDDDGSNTLYIHCVRVYKESI